MFVSCPGGRKYQYDMASLTVNVKYWKNIGAPLFQCVVPGQQEDKFLQRLLQNKTLANIEPKADNCTKVRMHC